VVFNGDMLTEIDLAAVIRLHRERKAKSHDRSDAGRQPVGAGGRDRRVGQHSTVLEKPKPEEITCNTINAGIYVLEPDTFDRIPKDTAWSIERSFFPFADRAGRDVLRVCRSRVLIGIST
jgi:NDP-sugar pyrophosphorylase family protein